MNLSNEDQRKIVEWAKARPEIKKIFLFGSRARRDNKNDSDIDLAVVLIPQPKESIFTTGLFWQKDYKNDPNLKLSHAADVQWYEPNSPDTELVDRGVKTDGILLYEK